MSGRGRRAGRPPDRLRGRAPGGRPPGEPHRAPRRQRGGAADPARGPRGVQVRPGATLVKTSPTGGPSRRSSRSTSRCAAAGGTTVGDEDGDDEASRQLTGGRAARRRATGKRRRRGGLDARGAGRAALQGPARRRRGAHGGRWPARRSTRYAGMEPGRPVGGTYYLYRTLRNLDLDGVLDRLMARSRGGQRAGRGDRRRGAR